MNLKIKICGITNSDDALRCVEAGAHALGFIFYEGSPRKISTDLAADIIARLPAFVTPVGVFVNETRLRIEQVIRETQIRIIQLSGDELPHDCAGYPIKVWKAFRFRPGESIARVRQYSIAAAVADGYGKNLYGGTGMLADPDTAIAIKKFHPVVLAGGLNPVNILPAVRTILPFAVDVNSGVESKPGRKDPEKLTALFDALDKFSHMDNGTSSRDYQPHSPRKR
jgi:phosphoribosylanthranilate isomerase